jgi:uncharacterized protein (TIGR00297 family)
VVGPSSRTGGARALESPPTLPAVSPPPPAFAPHVLGFDTTAGRALAGLAVACVIAIAARRARALSPSGAVAAVVIGTATLMAGWSWGALLIAFFVSSTLLSRLGAARKASRTEGIVAKGGQRDAIQVIANGALFAAAGVGALVGGSPAWPGWAALGAGALAAAAADTWATEIGTLAARPPRSIISGQPVPPGTSGGITTLGTLAAVAGACFVAGSAAAFGWPPRVALAGAAGGFAGAMADSLLGATLQAHRWCDRCGVATERTTHSCGHATRPSGGVPWLDNDAVNLLCAGLGAAVALALAG